jgi:transcriptional regulator with XRE-family HTH domain
MPKNKDLRTSSLDDLIKKAKPKKQKDGISNRIGEILTEKNMTKQELADLTELYPSHISEIVSGTRKGITLPIAIKIANALGMKVEEVFFKPIINK